MARQIPNRLLRSIPTSEGQRRSRFQFRWMQDLARGFPEGLPRGLGLPSTDTPPGAGWVIARKWAASLFHLRNCTAKSVAVLPDQTTKRQRKEFFNFQEPSNSPGES
jgi:hypothetical protein